MARQKGHAARFTWEFPPREEKWLMEYVANKIYDKMMSNTDFPYDATMNPYTGKPNTKDPRKVYTKRTGKWHLKEHGAAFVGGRKIRGANYMGPVPHVKKNVATWIWSMKKRYGKSKEKEIDYASYQDYIDVYPTYHQIEDAVDEALDDWWNRNYA